jgi:hypothetical protein
MRLLLADYLLFTSLSQVHCTEVSPEILTEDKALRHSGWSDGLPGLDYCTRSIGRCCLCRTVLLVWFASLSRGPQHPTSVRPSARVPILKLLLIYMIRLMYTGEYMRIVHGITHAKLCSVEYVLVPVQNGNHSGSTQHYID